jgi:hypothetical protein
MQEKPTGSFLNLADGIDWVARCELGAKFWLKERPMFSRSFLRGSFFLLPE